MARKHSMAWRFMAPKPRFQYRWVVPSMRHLNMTRRNQFRNKPPERANCPAAFNTLPTSIFLDSFYQFLLTQWDIGPLLYKISLKALSTFSRVHFQVAFSTALRLPSDCLSVYFCVIHSKSPWVRREVKFTRSIWSYLPNMYPKAHGNIWKRSVGCTG